MFSIKIVHLKLLSSDSWPSFLEPRINPLSPDDILKIMHWNFLHIDDISFGSCNGLISSGDKPLHEPMLSKFMTPYCVTRPQWVKFIFKFKFKSKYVYCQYIEIQHVYNCQHCVSYTLQPNRYQMEWNGNGACRPAANPGFTARGLPSWCRCAPRPWDHTTQPRIGRPKMKLRTTEPQMSRSCPTQSRSTRIAVPAPAARTTRPRCPIFPQAPRGMLHQRLIYDSNLE